ncbi:putative tricarboxylic transport membrane protein [Streptosporangium becharense]|uniref:Putative tricarboxylic transport membrane protein n=1 Tax=Streptosporangium becharense TaxID=1816182 RepID=A0A7W9MJ01_9ACTN|nr:tripartite tricarboxylate transporter substrate-binding protein [Streptosporangium becharense]MBB2911450.1 putative tricarboxylic transport membrane protein [Streptosporangium becharense]MBB5822732.1 putative tricarboxylic transport membrane protein [Streptosporangium becharense]
MRRRGFLALVTGVVAAAGCGPAGGPAGTAVDRLSVVAPAVRGQGWEAMPRTLAGVLTRCRLARAVEIVDHPAGAGSAVLDRLGSPGGPFTGEGRVLVAGMSLVAGAEIAGTAPLVGATTPLARLVGDWAALVVPDGSRLRSFDDFAAGVRRDPAGLAVGGRLEGGSDHVLYGMIGKCLGADARLLDYAGYLTAADAAEALHLGRVAALLGPARSFRSGIAAGRLRPLVVSSGERVDGIDAPTLMELDVRLEYSDWCGLLGPARMAEADLDAAVALCDRIDAAPDWRARCAANGWSRVYLSGDDFRQWLSTETARTREVLHDLGLLKSSDTTCWGSCVRRH